MIDRSGQTGRRTGHEDFRSRPETITSYRGNVGHSEDTGVSKELLAAGYWLLAFGYWLLASICGFGEREAEDGKLRVWSRQLKAGSQQLF
jgi:hypothetical protein